MDIATTRKNRPKGRFFEKGCDNEEYGKLFHYQLQYNLYICVPVDHRFWNIAIT